MTLAGTLGRKIWQITRENTTWGPTTSMSDRGIYTWKILPGTYPGLKDQVLWKGVLEHWRMEMYITYHYQELHKYRVLVLWREQVKPQ